MKVINKYLFFILAFFLCVNVQAGKISKGTVLDFEGLKDGELVGKHYKDYGIEFKGATAVIDEDDGGSGNVANEPEPGNTTIIFLDSDNLIMNVKDGFTNGFSFYYSSIDRPAEVTVWEGLDGMSESGKPLATIPLKPLGTHGNGDPTGEFDKWVQSKKIKFHGTAKSVKFSGVSNAIGFDNISFDVAPPSHQFDFSMKLKDITKNPEARYSDTFRMIFKDFKFTGNDTNIDNFCSKYKFRIKDSNGRGAWQRGDCKKIDNNLFSKDDQVQADFQVKDIDGKLYFENAKVEVCRQDDETDCKKVDGIENFSVYGTSFDIKKHAFSFGNGRWNRAKLDDVEDKLNHAKAINNIAHASEIIVNNYIKSKYREELWNSIGWEKEKEHWYSKPIGKVSQGLCYGMAASSIANFNHKGSNATWGIGGDIKTKWSKQIEEHEEELQTKPKPFNTDNIYTFKKDDIESFKKILYYYVSQRPFFEKKIKGKWIGGASKEGMGIYEDGEYYNKEKLRFFNKLKAGKPIIFTFDFTIEGAHTTVLTQIIKYNNQEKWVMYDNNEPNNYRYIEFNGKAYFLKDRNGNRPYLKKHGSLKVIYGEFVLNGDLLNVYNEKSTKPSKRAIKTMQKREVSSQDDKTYNYKLYNHIRVTLNGGKYLSIKEKDSQKVVSLSKIVDSNLDKNKAYEGNKNLFSTQIYLPNDKIYEIKAQKDGAFPFLKVFAKIPNKDGKIEIINYENIQTSEDANTTATFYVGVNNADKIIKRDVGGDYSSDYDKNLTLAIDSPKSLNPIVKENAVDLSWTNTKNPNLKEVIIVRKENSKAKNPSDGKIVYTGIEENYLDNSVDMDKEYYYSAFSKAKDDTVSSSVDVRVNTYRYTIYGKVIDEHGNALSNVNINLYNQSGEELIFTAYTNNEGNYAINNLANGTYKLKITYLSKSQTQDVKVENKSKEKDITLGEKKTEITPIIPPTNENPSPKKTVKYDFDGDEKISQKDIMQVANKWNSKKGDSSYELKFDLNNDGIIDIVDIMLVSSKWEEN